jgi:hypothetical protein
MTRRSTGLDCCSCHVGFRRWTRQPRHPKSS